MKTVHDLLAEAIKANEADGLCNSCLECGCSLTDLCPCGEPHPMECSLGWVGPAPDYANVDEWFYPSKSDADNAKKHDKNQMA